ncbi:hypothetical protein PILCRDRAFT_1916 [Piloderma croceum F 1598]|uniref:Uncharacterized protein n=1 Tax=Piloderma croceum (strain F 1598) TaxID=765440 RepID=A0A0C3FZ36_PILCF|nr:hypothetical protein PILCRDRAFT_1916 [Piloderma croceum F 1598]
MPHLKLSSPPLNLLPKLSISSASNIALECSFAWVDWSFVGIERKFEPEEVVDGWLRDWIDFGFGSIWRRGGGNIVVEVVVRAGVVVIVLVGVVVVVGDVVVVVEELDEKKIDVFVSFCIFFYYTPSTSPPPTSSYSYINFPFFISPSTSPSAKPSSSRESVASCGSGIWSVEEVGHEPMTHERPRQE